jgi:hypothetical protein
MCSAVRVSVNEYDLQRSQRPHHVSQQYDAISIHLLQRYQNLVSSSLLGGHLEVDSVLVVRRETGGDDGPKVGGLELVGLGESSHGSLQEVTLGSGRSLGLG